MPRISWPNARSSASIAYERSPRKLRFAVRSTSRRQTIKLPSERSPLPSNPVPARDFAHRDWSVIGNFWLQLEVERSEAEQVRSCSDGG